ncbi:MAG: hypothetical protein M3O70_28340 [Actinomycetota bacterium]|nr:hypothetical protein [Actinomycetota bacterium]
MSFTVMSRTAAWATWHGPDRVTCSDRGARLAVAASLASPLPIDRPAGIGRNLATPEAALLVFREALAPVEREEGDVRDPGPADGCIQPTLRDC